MADESQGRTFDEQTERVAHGARNPRAKVAKGSVVHESPVDKTVKKIRHIGLPSYYKEMDSPIYLDNYSKWSDDTILWNADEFVSCYFTTQTCTQLSKGASGPTMRMLLAALIAYLRDWVRPEDCTIENVLTLLHIGMRPVSAVEPNSMSALDILFNEIETGIHLNWMPSIDGGKTVEMPSMRVNNTTGKKPGLVRRTRYDKRQGLRADEDFALSMYKGFKTACADSYTYSYYVGELFALLCFVPVRDLKERMRRPSVFGMTKRCDTQRG